MGKKAIGVYLRVSSAGQDLGSQEPDLKAWLKVHGRSRRVVWYRDTFTGRTMKPARGPSGAGGLELDSA